MSIIFQRTGSQAELLERLKTLKHFVLLGKNDESPNEFFFSITSCCGIGVFSQGHGLAPFAVEDELNGDVWVGFNSKVANLALDDCISRFEVSLEGVFYSILGDIRDGSVIVIHELGACRISRDGKIRWSYSTDVIEDYSDEGNIIRLLTDSEEILIHKDKGAFL